MSDERGILLEGAFVALISANERLNRRTVELMKPWDVTPQQYNVLRILRGTGPDGKPSQQIAGDMISKVPDITRLVDRLASAGLAERRDDSRDRRVVRVAITEAGLELLDRMDGALKDLHVHTLGGFTDEELVQLGDLLGRI